jgi:hypothetical protein
VLLVLGLGSLVGTYVAALLFLIPLLAWEAIGHAASLYVIHAATKASPAAAPYVGLTGLLMLTACIGGSIFLHLERWFKGNEPAAAALMGGFTLLWGAVAVRLQVGGKEGGKQGGCLGGWVARKEVSVAGWDRGRVNSWLSWLAGWLAG